ncbi:MAG: TlpA family protein disulfide reductase [Ilumatobacter sp.]
MPGWQTLQDELSNHDFQVIAVAIDEAADTIRNYIQNDTDGISYPVLMDVDHVVSELYAISNVPTVLLIDEDDQIVQPNWNAYATNTFKDFHGIDADAQLNAIRRWVTSGETMISTDDVAGSVADLTADEELGKLHFRLATHLRNAGDAVGAERNFDIACTLAPHDWTIRRASMPLRGGDPFGPEFFELVKEYTDAGSPYHGINHPGTT